MATPRSSLGAGGPYPRAGEAGWALLETLVSAVLLIVVALAIASSLDTATRASAENKQRSVAASVAEQDQERMRGLDATVLSNYHPVPRTVTTLDGGKYAVTSRADWIRDSTGAVESCTQNTTQPDYLRITSTVTSAVVGTDTQPVVSRGIVTPPVGTFGPDQGTFAVEVVDRNGAKVPNMTVTTSGSQVLSDLTNSLGCAVFGYIPVGGYTGTASAQDWVDRDGNPTASGSATVSQGNVSTAQLTYDLAGSLAVTLDGSAPTGTKLNINQPAFVTPRTLTSPITPGQTSLPAVGSLFPFTASTYTAYVGSCADNKPGTYGQTVASKLVTRGTPATPLSVHLPTIKVTVKKGTPVVPNAKVRIWSTVGGCTESWQGTANATGNVTVPMPYGHYNVCASDAVTPIANRKVNTPVDNITSAGPSTTVTIVNNAGGGACW